MNGFCSGIGFGLLGILRCFLSAAEWRNFRDRREILIEFYNRKLGRFVFKEERDFPDSDFPLWLENLLKTFIQFPLLRREGGSMRFSLSPPSGSARIAIISFSSINSALRSAIFHASS